MILNGAQKYYPAVAKSRAASSASRPTGIAEGSNAGRYAGVESVASGGTPAAKTGAVSGAQPTSTSSAVTTPSVSPYLTATQIGSYSTAMGKDLGVINGAAANQANLYNKFATESAANGAKAQTSFNNTNQADAARGFGFSGVHDNAMADIQANAVMNQNNYNTAYRTGLATLASNVTNAQNDLGQLGLQYSALAGENAQTLASSEGATVNSQPYVLPTVASPATPTPVVTPAPVTYFNNPNMGAINSAITAGASAGGGMPS